MGNGKPAVSIESSTMNSPGEAVVQSTAPGISRGVSLNFSVAKVIAIFMVVAGHWFAGTILWIPVTFGLFVFAFSSAYFTSRIYGVELDRKRFWRKKLERLGLRFWVIMSFLTILLAFEGRVIFHWHTLMHFLGLSGVLNWLAIPSRSALGAGLWFFTLLLMFYVAYPYLAKLSQSKAAAILVSVVATVAAVFLEEKVKVGHELWLTSLGFILGVAYGLHEPRLSSTSAFILAGLSCACLLGLNLFSSYRQFNTVLIAAASISISLWLSKARLPPWPAAKTLAKLENYLLEIFIMHTYLFVHVSGNPVLDFALSLALIVIAAIAVNHVVAWLSSRVFSRVEN
jgi:hypothetical protein